MAISFYLAPASAAAGIAELTFDCMRKSMRIGLEAVNTAGEIR
jgi:hypothetical protein